MFRYWKEIVICIASERADFTTKIDAKINLFNVELQNKLRKNLLFDTVVVLAYNELLLKILHFYSRASFIRTPELLKTEYISGAGHI